MPSSVLRSDVEALYGPAPSKKRKGHPAPAKLVLHEGPLTALRCLSTAMVCCSASMGVMVPRRPRALARCARSVPAFFQVLLGRHDEIAV